MLISIEEVVMKEVKELMGLGKSYEVLKIDEVKEEKQIVKYIYIEKITKKRDAQYVIVIQNQYMTN